MNSQQLIYFNCALCNKRIDIDITWEDKSQDKEYGIDVMKKHMRDDTTNC